MSWFTVITLLDGTTVEVPIPSSGETDEDYRYRVRSADTVLEFETLSDVANHLLDRNAAGQNGGSELAHHRLSRSGRGDRAIPR